MKNNMSTERVRDREGAFVNRVEQVFASLDSIEQGCPNFLHWGPYIEYLCPEGSRNWCWCFHLWLVLFRSCLPKKKKTDLNSD